MPVYHFSEDPGISRFTPRAPKHHPDAKPMVWAIDDWHSPLYFFPPDCPRVCFWPLPETTEEDLEHYWLDPSLRMVIAIEAKWLPILSETSIYRYELPDDTFIDCHDHGVFVSESEVTPLRMTSLRPLIQELPDAGVGLRVCPSLPPLAERVMRTSFHWSLIRMKFAQDWKHAAGMPTMPSIQGK